jgi:histidinol-phosphatase (PHP family)
MINLKWLYDTPSKNQLNGGSILTDYHMHSTFSPDAKNTLDEMCQHAIQIGFTEIAFTEHYEWHPDWQGNLAVEAYFEEIARVKEQYAQQGLKVYAGIELGNPHLNPEEASDLLQCYQFDVVLASLHWLRGTNIHLKKCFLGRNPTDVYAEYFLEIKRMSECCDFDILAHFDRLFWPGWMLGELPNLGRLETIIRTTLEVLAANHQILELNTKLLPLSPVWRDQLVTIIGWYKEAGGGAIIISSDSHHYSEIGRNFDLAETILEQANLSVLNPAVDLKPRERLVMC